MLRTKFILLSVILVLGIVWLGIAIFPASAAPPGGGPTEFEIPNPLKCKDFPCVLDAIANFLIVIAAPILTVVVLWAGFLFLISGGDPTKVVTARKALIWAAVGFAVILIAKGITSIIKQILGGGA